MNNDLLYRYFMGTVTPEEGMAVKQWVEASEDNRKAFFRERRMFDAMLLVGDEAPVVKRRPALRRLGRAVLKVASVAALLFFAVLLYDSYTEKRDTFAVVSVPAGQRTHTSLCPTARVCGSTHARRLDIPHLIMTVTAMWRWRAKPTSAWRRTRNSRS